MSHYILKQIPKPNTRLFIIISLNIARQKIVLPTMIMMNSLWMKLSVFGSMEDWAPIFTIETDGNLLTFLATDGIRKCDCKQNEEWFHIGKLSME